MSRLLLISFLSFNFSVSAETNQWVEYFKYEGEGGDTRIAEYNTRIGFDENFRDVWHRWKFPYKEHSKAVTFHSVIDCFSYSYTIYEGTRRKGTYIIKPNGNSNDVLARIVCDKQN
mgnify:FL=1